MRFSFNIAYAPGKDLTTVDALPRALLIKSPPGEDRNKKPEPMFLQLSDTFHPQKTDFKSFETSSNKMQLPDKSWPTALMDGLIRPNLMKPYRTISGELTVQQGLLMKGSRLVIPIYMHLDILDRLHEGHQGITRYPCGGQAQVLVSNWKN